MNSDGQRTPTDLAQLLGRAGYATILQLRRLAALGLIEPPAVDDRTTDNPDFVRLPLEPDAGTATSQGYRPSRLPRRKPGAKLPKDLPADGPPMPNGTDEVLLTRIRTALRAMR